MVNSEFLADLGRDFLSEVFAVWLSSLLGDLYYVTGTGFTYVYRIFLAFGILVCKARFLVLGWGLLGLFLDECGTFPFNCVLGQGNLGPRNEECQSKGNSDDNVFHGIIKIKGLAILEKFDDYGIILDNIPVSKGTSRDFIVNVVDIEEAPV